MRYPNSKRGSLVLIQCYGRRMSNFLLAALAAMVLVFALTTIAGASPTQSVVPNLLQNANDKITVKFDFGNFTSQQVAINGKSYTKIALAGESEIMDVGSPALPTVSRSVIIPDDAKAVVSVSESSFYEIKDIDVSPSKGLILRTVNPDDVPYTFAGVYNTDAFFPAQLASLGQPYILRDYRGVVVTASPFQYNPVRRVLRVYTYITVEVSVAGKGGVNALNRAGFQRLPNRLFRDIYKRQFINYTAVESDVSAQFAALDTQGDMLIIANDAWIANLAPLAEHKNSIGINTTIVSVSTIGNNSTSIKNYIQNVYNTSDLAYVLLVGDAAQVAMPTASGGSSDPTYSKLAGSDNYPDIFVGRFSAETAADVDTQVLKTIEYENLPATQQDWFWRGVGIASPEGGPTTGDDAESDQQHIEGLRLQLLSYNYTLVDQVYEALGPTKADITNAVNAGRGIINYCGHGSITAWGTTGFSVTDVDALANDNMLPFIFDVACVNGQFNGYTCFAEAWMRATNGIEPAGAIGIYASSINQSWAPPMEAQDAFNSLYIAGSYNAYGALCYAASCSMMDKYGTGGADMFNTWHIFGDPSLRIVGSIQIDANVAGHPSPNNGAANVDPNIVLAWTPGTYAASHDVYFGTDLTAVSEANQSSPEFKGNLPLDNNSFSPGPLDYSTTYFWAIDEVNETSVWPGNVWSFTTMAPPDITPPNPNPMTWATVPYATGSSSVSMTATAASDLSGVEYYFECTAGGGHNSAWQDSATYQDTGLNPAAQYTYRVKARDKSANLNETGWSTEQSATTQSPSVAILGSWITGTTHAKEVGSNRALVFIAHAERSSSVTLNSVKYGGRSMTKVVDKVISSGSTRTYVAAFILKDADITAATNTTFVPTWSANPSSKVYASVFLNNVNQTTPTGATASNATSSGATITTSALANANRDMVVVAATCSNTGSYTVNNAFTEAIEPSISNADAVEGYKSATGASLTPSVTHSTSNGRQSLIGLVVKVAPPG